MIKITIEREEPPITLTAQVPIDTYVGDMFSIFNGMLISLTYQWGSIEDAITELAENIKNK